MTTVEAQPVFATQAAQRLLCKRYAHRGKEHPECPRCGIHHEDEDQLLWRIALGKLEYIDTLFRPLRFLPNSPTIFNLPCAVCGETRPAGTLSACFKFDVEDSMVGIMEVARKAALVLKFGGGVGYYVGGLRAKGVPIKSTHGAACGPVSVLRFYHSLAMMITQAGKRNAAQMAIIDDDHPDIHEFIHMKDEDPQGLSSFNISVAASDDFMSHIEDNEDDASLFTEIIESAWKTGDPGLYFKDTAERGNPTPWLGKLSGTNPCGEVPLLDNEPCLTGDTLIDVGDGLRRIDELTNIEGFSVALEDGTRVNGCYAIRTGRKTILRIETMTGQKIRLTPNHQVLTEHGWKRAEDVVPGSLIRMASTPSAIAEREESLEDEMLGWFVGDGWLTQEHSAGIIFADSDEEAYRRLRPVWDHYVGKEYAVQVQPTGVRQISVNKRSTIQEKFLNRGFKLARGTGKELPTYILTARPYQQQAFLRGLFGADGCVKKAGNGRRNLVSLSSSSENLLQQVQLLLLRFGIQGRIQWSSFSTDRNDQGQLQISGISAKKFIDIIGFTESRKTRSYQGNGNAGTKNHEYAKVRAITEAGEQEDVFDISVPEQHRFIANGLVVHNCNLGSINLAARKSYIGEELENTVRAAVRYLDEILDQNSFPDPAIADAALTTRKLGLGVMGWADTLAVLRIPYDSQEAVDLGRFTMDQINAWAHGESRRLAAEKNMAPCFADRPAGKLLRNATLTCIAPTGSISMLAGCSSGIEPHFALEYTHEMGDGEVTKHRIAVLNQIGDFVPKVANEISVDWHLKHQAAFQKHTDLAVSKTINLPNSATVEDVGHAYLTAWKLGCKGVTVFRDGCRANGEQVLVASTNGHHIETKQFDFGSIEGISRTTLFPEPPHFISETPRKTVARVEEIMVKEELLSSPGDPFISQRSLRETLENAVEIKSTGEIRGIPVRRKLEPERQAITHRFQVGEQEGYLTVGLFPDGQPGELFVKISKEGSTASGLMDGVAILTSLALQYGIPIEALVKKFRHTRFEPSGMTDNADQRFATSILDYVFRWLERKFLTVTEETVVVGENCPECGGTLVHAEGCVHCNSCGYDRCG